MEFLTTLTEFIFLNLLFLICCLPIVTIGAALSAMYSVCLQEARKEYGYKIRSFIKNFKLNFLPSTGLFVILFAVLAILLFNLEFWFHLNTIVGNVLFVVLLIPTFCFVVGFIYAFPLIARFQNNIRQTIKNSILLALMNRKATFLLLLTHILFILFAFFIPKSGIIILFVGFSFFIYLNSIILLKVFRPYEEADENPKMES